MRFLAGLKERRRVDVERVVAAVVVAAGGEVVDEVAGRERDAGSGGGRGERRAGVEVEERGGVVHDVPAAREREARRHRHGLRRQVTPVAPAAP